MKQAEYTIGPNDQNRRLDRILKKAFPRRSPGDLYKALRKGLILVNGGKAGPENRLKEGDRLLFKGALAEELFDSQGEPASWDPASEEGGGTSGRPALPGNSGPPLPLIWENEDLICLNKPRGMLVHGADSLEIRVRNYLADRIGGSLSFTPGPLHRLDRNTTGLIVFSRSLRGAQKFTEKLRDRRLVKLYLTLLEGSLEERGLWEDSLSRREGVTVIAPRDGAAGKTEVLPVLSASGLTLAIVRIHTGKPHQIRAQAAHHGHPLAGDVKYGGSPRPGGFRLHAWRLLDPESPPLFPPLKADPPDGFFGPLKGSLLPRELLDRVEKKLLAPKEKDFFPFPLGKGGSGE